MAKDLSNWVQELRRWWVDAVSNRRAEAELRALDERELHDLGLERGGIAYAARWGRAMDLTRT